MTQSPEKIDHVLDVMTSVQEMRNEEFMCDFKIKVGTETFNTHGLILAANSGYFRHLFSSNMKEVDQRLATLSIATPRIIRQCIDYMYTSTCDLQSESVSQILQAANFLQILRLETACFKFLQDNLVPENSLSVLNLARTYHSEALEKDAQNVIQSNLETVMSTELFLQVSKQDLFHYISKAKPQMSWKALTVWCNGRKKDFPELAEKVKISELSFNFLLNEVLDDPLVAGSEKIKTAVIEQIFSSSLQLELNVKAENCFRLRNLATNQKSKNIIESFMKRNFSKIFPKSEFCAISKQDVISLLKSPEVKPEELKWDAILKWVNKDIQNREEHFIDLFQCISIDKVAIEFLKGTIRQDKLVQANAVCMGMLVDSLLNRPIQAEALTASESVEIDKPVKPEAFTSSKNGKLFKPSIWTVSTPSARGKSLKAKAWISSKYGKNINPIEDSGKLGQKECFVGSEEDDFSAESENEDSDPVCGQSASKGDESSESSKVSCFNG